MEICFLYRPPSNLEQITVDENVKFCDRSCKDMCSFVQEDENDPEYITKSFASVKKWMSLSEDVSVLPNSRSPHGTRRHRQSHEAAPCPSLNENISDCHKEDEIERGLPRSSADLQVHMSSPSSYETSERILQEQTMQKETNPKTAKSYCTFWPSTSYATNTEGLDLLVSAAMEISSGHANASNDRDEKSFQERKEFDRKEIFDTVSGQNRSTEMKEEIQEKKWIRERWDGVKRKGPQKYCARLPKTKEASGYGDSVDVYSNILAERNESTVIEAARTRRNPASDNGRSDAGDGSRQTQRSCHVIALKNARKCSTTVARSGYKAKACGSMEDMGSGATAEPSVVEICISIDTKPFSELQKNKLAMNPSIGNSISSVVHDQPNTQDSSSGSRSNSNDNNLSESEGFTNHDAENGGAYVPVASMKKTCMWNHYVQEEDGSAVPGALKTAACYGQQTVSYADRDPLVRSKRGRNQHLPTKFFDSVLQPWKRKSRPNHCHGQGSMQQDVVT